MKKKIFVILAIVVLLILLFPIPMRLKDGGSIEFKALLYTVTKYHTLDFNSETGFVDGIGIKILGKEIYNNINKKSIVCEDNNKEEYKVEEYHSFVATVLEETTKYMLVEPNEDEEERKSADKIMINYGTDHIDYLFGIGRKVIINYKGGIMETYPAQINTDDILIEGYENYEITVKESGKNHKVKILNNQDISKYNSDYDLYYYGLDEVNITIEDKTMSLEEALKMGKITLNGLIIKANKDFPDAISYDDGGSREYHYENYTIIKLHKIDGNRDVYIGTKDMTIHDI